MTKAQRSASLLVWTGGGKRCAAARDITCLLETSAHAEVSAAGDQKEQEPCPERQHPFSAAAMKDAEKSLHPVQILLGEAQRAAQDAWTSAAGTASQLRQQAARHADNCVSLLLQQRQHNRGRLCRPSTSPLCSISHAASSDLQSGREAKWSAASCIRRLQRPIADLALDNSSQQSASAASDSKAAEQDERILISEARATTCLHRTRLHSVC